MPTEFFSQLKTVPLVVFPPAKINLGLRITRKRDDGFHELETIFYPIRFFDALEILRSSTDTVLTTSGIVIDGNPTDNLCYKAWKLLNEVRPEIPPVRIHLHKNIPSGAGLGGGSADAAFTLQSLAKLYAPGADPDMIENIALALGSDCPFFLQHQPCFATGRGEMLQPVSIDLTDYKILLVNPGVHVNTKDAFANIIPVKTDTDLRDIIQTPVTNWKHSLKNDFEPSVFRQFPVIMSVRDQLYNIGATYASMSGSGSSVYGIFAKDSQPDLQFPGNFLVRWV